MRRRRRRRRREERTRKEEKEARDVEKKVIIRTFIYLSMYRNLIYRRVCVCVCV